MPDRSLTHAIVLLADAARLPTGEATRFLFDHYRCAKPETQDAIVLALIGSVMTARAMRAARPDSSSISSAAGEAS